MSSKLSLVFTHPTLSTGDIDSPSLLSFSVPSCRNVFKLILPIGSLAGHYGLAESIMTLRAIILPLRFGGTSSVVGRPSNRSLSKGRNLKGKALLWQRSIS